MKLFLCACLIALVAFTAAAADITGKWSGTYSFDNGNSGAAFVIFKQSGTAVSGTAGPGEDQQWAIEKGKVDGNKVVFEIKSPDDGTIYRLELTLAGDTLKGSVTAGAGDQSMKGKIEVARVK
jgi:hypothetical protein